MFNLSAKGAVICAMLPLCLPLAACNGIGEAGSHEVVAGNWDAAKADFNEDFTHHPEHPIAVFNMGATYHHDGDVNKADSMFSEAVQKGKGYVPDGTLEPATAGVTVAEHACARLHRDNKLDANCGDRIAMEAPPPPPVAQAAPAVEAEATAPPPRKQDRN
ncbi:MAG TPA: hypothetical protein VFI23_15670 [Rhizomicrobium sp.]|nr:hypothetical protein [Rhizomicrobium sp.]